MPGRKSLRKPKRSPPPVAVTPPLSHSTLADRREAEHLWLALARECGRFPQAQASHLLHAAGKMAHCRRVAEMIELQGCYIRDAWHECLDEGALVADIWTHAWFRAMSGLQPH